VFNDALHAREAAHQAGEPYITDSDLSAWLTAIKKTPERAWLNEVSSIVLQQALADLNMAYRNFFPSIQGTRKGPKLAKPRFRSRKDHRQAIRFGLWGERRPQATPRPRLAVPGVRGMA
jgi:putative transposase